jgi:hypothetical protein
MTRPVAGIICCTRTVGIEPAQAVMNRYVAGAMRYADAAAFAGPVDARADEGLGSRRAAGRPDADRQSVEHGREPLRRGRARRARSVRRRSRQHDRRSDQGHARPGPAGVRGVPGFQEINVAFGGSCAATWPPARSDRPPRARRGRLQRHVRPSASGRPDPGRRAFHRVQDRARGGQLRPLPGRRPPGRRPDRRGPRRGRRGRGRVGHRQRRARPGRAVAPRVEARRQPAVPDLLPAFRGRALRGAPLIVA